MGGRKGASLKNLQRTRQCESDFNDGDDNGDDNDDGEERALVYPSFLLQGRDFCLFIYFSLEKFLYRIFKLLFMRIIVVDKVFEDKGSVCVGAGEEEEEGNRGLIT